MEEDRENENLPRPKLETDVHRRQVNRKGYTSYFAVIYTTIHYLVEYSCCFCGAFNRDDKQVFRWSRYIEADSESECIADEAPAVCEEKTRKAPRIAAEMEKSISARKYKPLGLKCRCAQCGKKQPWSKFWPVGGVFRFLRSCKEEPEEDQNGISLGLLSSVIFLELVLMSLFPRAGAVQIFLILLAPGIMAAVPSAAAAVQNAVMEMKSRKLDEEYRPRIRIVYEAEEEDAWEDIRPDGTELSGEKAYEP